MSLHPTGHELTRRAIRITCERAIDAYTVEEAARLHSELLDLLAIEAMIVKMGSQSELTKQTAIRDINARARYHRDAVDRLTDIIETGQQLIWRP